MLRGPGIVGRVRSRDVRKVEGEGVPSRRRHGRPRERSVAADEAGPSLWRRGGLTRREGPRGPSRRGPKPAGAGRCSGLRARAGTGSEAWWDGSGGHETQEGNGRRVRATSVDANGLAGGTRLRSRRSWRKKAIPLFEVQGDREVVNLATKRGPIAAGGTRRLRLRRGSRGNQG